AVCVFPRKSVLMISTFRRDFAWTPRRLQSGPREETATRFADETIRHGGAWAGRNGKCCAVSARQEGTGCPRHRSVLAAAYAGLVAWRYPHHTSRHRRGAALHAAGDALA